ncbi:Uncharacterized protein HZ326_8404 [Fusarium oxysporum f. sp. albedinis]|nr:Uncharacterized protein HZ326_8404 [Fusarium oxysporum f. sp. albedinis]
MGSYPLLARHRYNPIVVLRNQHCFHVLVPHGISLPDFVGDAHASGGPLEDPATSRNGDVIVLLTFEQFVPLARVCKKGHMPRHDQVVVFFLRIEIK